MFFLVRRFTLAVLVIIDFDMLVFQVAIVFLCGFISINLMHGVQPFTLKKWTRMETLNEVFVLTAMYNFIAFDAISFDVEGTFWLGYFVIGIVSLHILVNILLILRQTYIDKKVAIRLWQGKRRYIE